MGAIVLGHHHDTRRAPVEPVHDAWPELTTDAAQVADVVQQRVHQRTCRVAGSRMNHHAGRLVHDDEVGILVENGQRQVFWNRCGRRGIGNLDRDALARLHAGVGLDASTADGDVAVANQALKAGARVIAEQ